MTATTTPKPLPRRAWLLALLTAAVALVTLVLAPAAAQAATNTFQGPGNDWNTPANWSQASVPDSTDDVIIPSNKSVALSTAPNGVANSIAHSGSSLLISGGRTLTVGTGASAFAGTVTVAQQAKIRLNGTTTWSAGTWQFDSIAPVGGTIENAGTLNITGNVSTTNFGGGQMRNLAGATVNRTTSSGTATLAVPFDNDGTVSVQTGELALTQGTGPAQQSTGSFATTVSGAALAFNGGGPDSGPHNLSSTASITGPGTARYDGATTALASGATYSPATTQA